MAYSAAETNTGNVWGNISIQERLKKRKKGQSFHPTHKGIDWDSIKNFSKTLGQTAAKIILAAALCYGIFQAHRFVTASDYFAITKVIFAGQNILAGENLEERLGPIGGKSIFLQDMKILEKKLAAHPWIQSVSVTRRLPNSLYVQIVERIPYARIQLDEVYLLDNFGILLDRAAPEYSHLPLITGIKAGTAQPGEYAASKNIISGLKIMHYLNQLEFFLDDPFNTVRIKNDYRLTFTSSSRGIKVHFLAATIDEGFKNLKLILNAIEAKGLEVEYIDLSFKDKVVIKKAHTA